MSIYADAGNTIALLSACLRRPHTLPVARLKSFAVYQPIFRLGKWTAATSAWCKVQEGTGGDLRAAILTFRDLTSSQIRADCAPLHDLCNTALEAPRKPYFLKAAWAGSPLRCRR